ncbi:MAG: hypothetical protein WAL38_25295, partial [Solirubrobacteraceae bacterium]
MISIGAPTPNLLASTSRRLRRPRIPTTPATAPTAERDQTCDVGLYLFDVRRERLEQALAGLCRGDAARGSGQETDAESNFKLLDRVAE